MIDKFVWLYINIRKTGKIIERINKDTFVRQPSGFILATKKEHLEQTYNPKMQC